MARFVVILVFASSACSLMSMRSPPSRVHPRIPPDCTASKGLPAADILVGLAYLAFGFPIFVLSDGEKRVAAVVLGGATLHFVSAAWGVSKANTCNDVIDEWQASYTPPPGVPRAPFPLQPTVQPTIPSVPDPPPDDPKPAPPVDMLGAERGPCRATAPLCAGDLVCVSDRCVRPRK